LVSNLVLSRLDFESPAFDHTDGNVSIRVGEPLSLFVLVDVIVRMKPRNEKGVRRHFITSVLYPRSKEMERSDANTHPTLSIRTQHS